MKRKAFDIGMCILWALITIAYIVLGARGVQVSAYDVAWPCGFAMFTYLERIFDKGK